jgi:cysteine desulfurase
MRSGTLNVPGIVGTSKAVEIAQQTMSEEAPRTAAMRDRLHRLITDVLDEVYVNGHPTERLPGNLNLSFAYIEGESMLMGLNGSAHPDLPAIAVSSGSACTSATLEPSYVLKALGVGDELAHTSIRFGLGRFNTEEEVDYVAERVISEVQRLRELSPLYEMAKEGIDLKTYFAGARH